MRRVGTSTYVRLGATGRYALPLVGATRSLALPLRLYATAPQGKAVVEWTCDEVVSHLKERTDPPASQSLLDGFEFQHINGFALASVRPPTLFAMIKAQVERGPSADKIEVSDQLLQDTLLGTASYSVQRR